MYRLAIEDHDGNRTVVPVARDEVTIGRRVGSTIRLTDRNVSRNHARLRLDGGGLWLVDESRYGIWLNDRKVAGKAQVRQGDSLRVGDYRLTLLDEAANAIGLIDDGRVTDEFAMTADEAGSMDGPTTLITGAPAPAPETACHLVIVSQPHPGREIALDQSPITVGRSDENEVVIDHESLSLRHALFEHVEGRWEVQDLSTVNGVRVNGLGVEDSVLSDGDLVELGGVVFRFVDAGSGWRFRTVETFTDPPIATGRSWPLLLGIGLMLGVVLALLWSTVPPPPPTGPPGPLPAAPTAVELPPSASPPTPAPAVANDRSAELAEVTARAREAMQRRDWVAATVVLGRGADRGLSSAEAEAMFARARGEQANEARLRDGRTRLAAGELEQAALALRAVGPDSAYLAEAQDLSRRIQAAADAERLAAASRRRSRARRVRHDSAGRADTRQRLAATRERPAATRRASRSPRVPPAKTFEPNREERASLAKRHFKEGRRLHTLGKTAGAEIELRKAAAMAPGFAEPHLILGLIYTRAGRKPEAIRSLRRFLKLAPKDKRRTMVEKMLR